MKNDCSSISKLLEKYFDHEVTEQERFLFEGHLQDCPACGDALHSMELLRNLMKSPVEEAVEKESFPWVWQKIERRIQLKERPSGWEFLRSWFDITPLLRKKILIPAAALVAIVILVMVPFLFKKTTSYLGPSVVEYVESQTHNVMVYELENQKATVIWLFNGSEEETSTS